MRSVIFSFVLAILLSCVMPIFAGEIQESPDGSLRIAEEQEWRSTGVSVEDEALLYEGVWQKAYKNPGTLVPVATHTEHVADGFTVAISTVADEAVVYEEDAGVVRFVTDAGVIGERNVFNLPAALIGFAVMMMVVSNACAWWGRRSATFAAFASAFASIFAAFAAAFASTFAFATFAFATFGFASAPIFAFAAAFASVVFVFAPAFASASREGSGSAYPAASVLFYLAAFIAIVLMFA